MYRKIPRQWFCTPEGEWVRNSILASDEIVQIRIAQRDLPWWRFIRKLQLERQADELRQERRYLTFRPETSRVLPEGDIEVKISETHFKLYPKTPFVWMKET